MATIYKTRDGDVLDRICWQHYQREDAVPLVLSANPGLADAGVVLPSGIDITLPELLAPVSSEAVSLWD
ncbi:tail protein X [Vibrio fluvialis]|nr:tail protein X [Vibrio fluvialis]EKO3401915.1 tail protein X [Vibrio fluvialis]EKO4005535.1 phage tail protein [Vibrio fluvialis]ELG2041984.1 tail protein X [Vibrio fluvialis]